MKNAFKCPSDDYDFYSIPFSVKDFFPKKRNRYLHSQLEKLHPCFSDDCSFDSHLRLEKSGLKADVVVMQKYKLAQFKANKKRLYIKERSRHQFFAPKNKTLKIGVYVSVLLSAVLFLIFSISLNKREQVKAEQGSKSFLTEELIWAQTEQKLCTPDFLFLVADLQGAISDFSWSYDGYNENASMLLRNVFPEQLETFTPSLKLSSVAFEKSIPVFTAGFTSKIIQGVAQQKALQTQSVSNSKNTFRTLIIQNNLSLIEETVIPYGIKLSVKKEQSENFQAILGYLKQNDFSLSKIKISSSNDNLIFQCDFSQVKFESQNELYESLIENLQLFFPKALNEEEGRPASTPMPEPIPTPAITQTPLPKLGQIIKPDGTITTYYKDKNGKIIKR